MRSYTELSKLTTFEERYEYLKLAANVGIETFGEERYLNQIFYKSPEWKRIRNYVIARDEGCDLGIPGFTIYKKALVHHMNPLTKEEILDRADEILNPEYLITVSHSTHNAIHYGLDNVPIGPVVRVPGDTRLW